MAFPISGLKLFRCNAGQMPVSGQEGIGVHAGAQTGVQAGASSYAQASGGYSGTRFPWTGIGRYWAINRAFRKGDDGAQVFLYERMGNKELTAGRNEEAVDHFRKAAEIVRWSKDLKASNPDLEFRILEMLACALTRVDTDGSIFEAAVTRTAARQAFQGSQSKKYRMATPEEMARLEELATIEWNTYNLVYDRSPKTVEDARIKVMPEIIRLYWDLINLYEIKRNNERAVHLLVKQGDVYSEAFHPSEAYASYYLASMFDPEIISKDAASRLGDLAKIENGEILRVEEEVARKQLERGRLERSYRIYMEIGQELVRMCHDNDSNMSASYFYERAARAYASASLSMQLYIHSLCSGVGSIPVDFDFDHIQCLVDALMKQIDSLKFTWKGADPRLYDRLQPLMTAYFDRSLDGLPLDEQRRLGLVHKDSDIWFPGRWSLRRRLMD